MKGQTRQTPIEAAVESGFVTVGEGPLARRIAYLRREAIGAGQGRPGLVWLGGFKSDMRGTKAERLDRYAAETGRAFLRFDYSGHGSSEGSFESGTIGRWLEESLALLRALGEGPQVLVGSSMGGWLALLAASALQSQREASRINGLVLLAPAVDFTERLIWDRMPPKAQEELAERGLWLRPSPYQQDPYPISRGLIEEGRSHLLLGGAIRAFCHVHILQGMLDDEVPWRHATTLVEHLVGDAASLTLIKDGDHRLSRDEDLEKLIAAVEAIA